MNPVCLFDAEKVAAAVLPYVFNIGFPASLFVYLRYLGIDWRQAEQRTSGSAVQSSSLQCNELDCSALHCTVLQRYSVAVQCSALPCCSVAVQCSAVHYTV